MVSYNNACRTCHSMKPGDNRLGPSLHGVVGRKAGTLEGFAFSPAMKSSGSRRGMKRHSTSSSAIPNQVVSGNKMKPFGGVADASERDKIVNYLKTLK